MRYILSILPAIPITAVIAFLITALVLKRRAESWRNNRLKCIALFVLCWWVAMVAYITLFMGFGNGLGAAYNLVPFRDFIIAFKYGSSNAQGVWQWMLNIIMFVPLGFLLPLVFGNKMQNWLKILAASLAIAVSIELIQLLIARGADIDDVIANALGGVCGYALFLLAAWILKAAERKKGRASLAGLGVRPVDGVQALLGALLIVCVGGLFTGVSVSDGSSKYGNVYYGNLCPTAIQTDLSGQEEQEAPVYRAIQTENDDDLKTFLRAASGIEGRWIAFDSEGVSWVLVNAESLETATQACFLYSDGTWSLVMEYGAAKAPATGPKISEEAALVKADEYLNAFGIGSRNVTFEKDESGRWGSEVFAFAYDGMQMQGDSMLYGKVTVVMKKDGTLSSLSDRRIRFEPVETVSCISLDDALNVPLEVGCGPWNGVGVVESASLAYYLIEETGYLVPAWKLTGYLTTESGERMDWEPLVMAVIE